MTDPTRCPVTGYLVVDGRRVRALRCQHDAGHERELGTLHAVTFHWEDDVELAADWPEAYDPDEGFDVDVAPLPDAELERVERDLETDSAVERQARSDARQALEDRVSVRLAAMTDDELEAIARDADTDALIDAHRERRAFGDD